MRPLEILRTIEPLRALDGAFILLMGQNYLSDRLDLPQFYKPYRPKSDQKSHKPFVASGSSIL